MKIKKKAPYVVLLTLALAWSLLPAPTMAVAASPTADVKSLIDEVISILHNPAYQAPAQKQKRLALIEKASARRLDYQEMAKRSLDPTWDSLSKSQQTEFVALFSELLQASYADKLDEFIKADVAYQPEVLKGDHAEVPTVIHRPNDKIPVSFRVLQQPGGWMIYDLVIEGVSLVSNFNSQFHRVIQASSYASLVNCLKLQLKAKNVKLESCPVPEAEPAKPAKKKEG
jgi:phospholipid transport system substrate-binding protein